MKRGISPPKTDSTRDVFAVNESLRELKRVRRQTTIALHELPTEIVLYVFSFLDSQSLCRVAQVCHRLRLLAEKNQLWMPLYSLHFRQQISGDPFDSVWKTLYRTKYNWRRGNYHSSKIKAHETAITAISAAGSTIASGSSDGTIKLWKKRMNLDYMATLAMHKSRIEHLHINWDYVISTCSDGLLLLWSKETLMLSAKLREVGPKITYMTSLSDSFPTLITCQIGAILIWNLKDGTCMRTLRGSCDPILYLSSSFVNSRTVQLRFAQSISTPFTPSSLTLSSLIAEDNRLQDILPVHKEGLSTTKKPQKGKDENRKIRGLNRTRPVLNLFAELSNSSFFSRISTAQFSQSTVVTGSLNNTISVWEKRSDWSPRTLFGHTGAVVVVRFDEDKIVSAGRDHTIRVWDKQSHECLHIIQEHSAPLSSMIYGETDIISGDETGTLVFVDFNCGHYLPSQR